jgi:hypothetical protein
MGVIRMSEEDTNIRNPLISVIENKYKEHMIKFNISPRNGLTNGNGKKQLNS